MRPRINLARLILRLSHLLQSTAIMVMRPDDLVEFSRQTYARPHNVKGWSGETLIDSGLYPEEKTLLSKLPFSQGNMLLLGVGGGREAIPFAQIGFRVTGVDFVPEMVVAAQQNAQQNGVEIDGLVQEISTLDVPASAYDVIWISSAMYSCIPTRERREAMLQRIRNSLIQGGYLICQFSHSPDISTNRKVTTFRRLVALLSLGYLGFEPGDHLKHQIEFIHDFSSETEVRDEFEEAGFEVCYLSLFPEKLMGGAVLQKKPQ